MKTKPGFLAILGILCLFILPSCKNVAPDSPFGNAEWITATSLQEIPDSLMYGDHPAPVFVRTFKVPDPVVRAELLITAAGYYDSYLNGARTGDQQLDPAWTDFSRRVWFTRIDVTQQVKKGSNVWLLMTGNGFYNPLPMKMWGNLNLRKHVPMGDPKVIARLVVTMAGDKTLTVETNESWLTKPGPVIRNNVYLGEWYDAGKEPSDLDKARRGRNGWEAARVVEGPGGTLQEAFFPPVRMTEWVPPVSIKRDSAERIVVDFGQNFTGVVRMKIRADKGDTIRFLYGERLWPNGSVNPMTGVCGQIKRAGVGGPGAPALAAQEDVFIASGQPDQVFQPRFTFHGFRYVQVTGLGYLPDSTDLAAIRLHSDVTPVVSTRTWDPYLEKLQQASVNTFLSNLISVQSDCPAREKFGYGGDINATAESYMLNFDMSSMYRKIVYDWADAVRDSGFVDTAPFIGLQYCGISWESAFINLQNLLLVHYSDTSLIKEMYDRDLRWMEKCARQYPDGLVTNGLSDHESLAKVPVTLTGTCHYLQAARTMAVFAKIMGKPEDERRFQDLSQSIRLVLEKRFWTSPAEKVENQQTLLASLLYYRVLQPDQQKMALERLLVVLKEADYHVSTGIFGTQALLNALSENGRTDIAMKVVNQPGFPGWRHMIDRGATSLWETWKESDNTFSQNHPMFGSVSGWYHKWIGGIRPDEGDPVSGRIWVAPQVISQLDSVASERLFPQGALLSIWKRKADGIHFEFHVPEGLNAGWLAPGEKMDTVKLPAGIQTFIIPAI